MPLPYGGILVGYLIFAISQALYIGFPQQRIGCEEWWSLGGRVKLEILYRSERLVSLSPHCLVASISVFRQNLRAKQTLVFR